MKQAIPISSTAGIDSRLSNHLFSSSQTNCHLPQEQYSCPEIDHPQNFVFKVYELPEHRHIFHISSPRCAELRSALSTQLLASSKLGHCRATPNPAISHQSATSVRLSSPNSSSMHRHTNPPSSPARHLKRCPAAWPGRPLPSCSASGVHGPVCQPRPP